MSQPATNNLVSIIIPTHNRSELLLETLLSIINQDYPFIEIVLVDDHSSYNTQKVIGKFMEEHPNINLLFLKNEGKGGCSARNTGIKNAHGEYIQFFDDDDIMNSDFISYRVNQIKKNNLDFATCDYVCFMDNTNNIVGEKRISNIPHTAVSHIMNSALPTPCFLFTRSAVEKLGLWNTKTKRLQDMAYYHRIFLYSLKGEWYDKLLFKYRVHKKNITHQQGINAILESLDEMYKEWKPISKNVCLALIRFRIKVLENSKELSPVKKMFYHLISASKYTKEYYIHFNYIKFKKRELFKW